MSDKKLEMLKEIEKIKKQELIDSAHSHYQFKNEISQINYRRTMLKAQLRSIENKEKSINSEISKIKRNHIMIERKLLSLKENRLNNIQLNHELIRLQNRESLFYKNLALLDKQKSELKNLLYDLDKKEFKILSSSNNNAYQSKNLENKYDILDRNNDTILSKSKKSTEIDRENYLLEITKDLFLNKITIGSAIKKLRVNILKINQEKFAQLTGVSRKTISEVENNRGNLSVETLNAIAKPFKLKLTLLPISSNILERIIDKH